MMIRADGGTDGSIFCSGSALVHGLLLLIAVAFAPGPLAFAALGLFLVALNVSNPTMMN
jgi:hypothetical protein